MLRAAGIVVSCGLLISAFETVAFASSPIGPNQHFVGVVNGRHLDAVVYTVCPGPATGDGPVAGGQTVAARRVAAGGGDTGSTASVIYARVTPTTIVSIKAYAQPVAIPASAQVPCQGTGTIVFSTCPLPQPCGEGAKVNSVPVRFIDLGA